MFDPLTLVTHTSLLRNTVLRIVGKVGREDQIAISCESNAYSNFKDIRRQHDAHHLLTWDALYNFAVFKLAFNQAVEGREFIVDYYFKNWNSCSGNTTKGNKVKENMLKANILIQYMTYTDSKKELTQQQKLIEQFMTGLEQELGANNLVIMMVQMVYIEKFGELNHENLLKLEAISKRLQEALGDSHPATCRSFQILSAFSVVPTQTLSNLVCCPCLCVYSVCFSICYVSKDKQQKDVEF